MTTQTITARRSIGPWGTAARAAVGVAMIVGAVIIGIDTLDVVLGLLAFPLAVVAVLALRGTDARPLRLTGSEGYCLTFAIGAAALIFVSEAALLFIGSSMLLAAARGYGGCEVFAVSNLLRRRDDQIACALFDPIDSAESHRGDAA